MPSRTTIRQPIKRYIERLDGLELDQLPFSLYQHHRGDFTQTHPREERARLFEERLRYLLTKHVEFESIHPFADGNGRAGRALLLHVLGVPIPISRFIHSARSTYYHLFRKSDWPSWLEWMAGGTLIESNMRL